ncbi:MAG: hypothetical protein RSG23_05035 [Gordonibacter sp.]
MACEYYDNGGSSCPWRWRVDCDPDYYETADQGCCYWYDPMDDHEREEADAPPHVAVGSMIEMSLKGGSHA